jgi:hypothetical protein
LTSSNKLTIQLLYWLRLWLSRRAWHRVVGVVLLSELMKMIVIFLFSLLWVILVYVAIDSGPKLERVVHGVIRLTKRHTAADDKNSAERDERGVRVYWTTVFIYGKPFWNKTSYSPLRDSQWMRLSRWPRLVGHYGQPKGTGSHI